MSKKLNPNKKEKEKNPKNFIEDSSLIELANEVINKNKLDYLNQIKIKYVLIDKYISKTCVGKCIKGGKELKHFADIDFVIEISNDIWQKIDDKGKEIIMLHLLLHILLSTNKNGDLITKIFNHDITDFSMIIKKYGMDELKNIKMAVVSIRDLDITMVDNIKI